MQTAPTIVDLLMKRGAKSAPGTGFFFVGDSGSSTEHVSFAELAEEVARTASGLLAAGFRKHDRVMLIIPNRKEFVLTFYGAIWAGIVPVPLSPPTTIRGVDAYANRVRNVVRCATPRGVITTRELRTVAATLLDKGKGLCVTTDLIFSSTFNLSDPTPVKRNEAALIQFTSGSTKNPRGVPLTNENLAINSQIHISPSVPNGPTESDVCVTWLPFFHDAGLLASLTGTLAFGGKGVFIPPLLFLKKPVTWLREVTKHRGTIVLAPNFSYALCTRRVTDEELVGLDLSSWTRVMCAAEMIRADTLRDFTNRFEPVGFRWSSWLPGYGLAEHVVATTFDQSEERPRFDRVDRDTIIDSGIAKPTTSADALEIACCGQAFVGHQVRTIDERSNVCADRQIGEIQVKGASLMSAYIDHTPLESGITEDGWFNTGDLGYMIGEDLYVTGRKKELVIVEGRNHYPTDIEDVVSKIEGIRAGNVIAFGVPSQSGTEELVICAEVRDVSQGDDIASKIRGLIAESLGVEVSDVRTLPPGTLPKTTSGKLRRQDCRNAYVSGSLGMQPRLTMIKSLKRLAEARWHLLKSDAKRTLE